MFLSEINHLDHWVSVESREYHDIMASPLGFMLSCYQKVDDNDPDLDVPRPAAVLEVIDLDHRNTITRSETTMVARCRCNDDQEYVLRCWHNCWGGSLARDRNYSVGIEIVL